MSQVLVIIDMQQGSFGEETPKFDAAGLVQRLNRLGRSIREAGGAVVFIQHDGPPGDLHHPDLPGWRLLPDLVVEGEDTMIRKTSCDAFLGTNLEAVLQARAPDQVIITGCATDYCVDTTVRSALARSYKTLVPSDGHTTSNRPHLRAEQIIEHHNAIWADFIAPAGPALVYPCAEISISR